MALLCPVLYLAVELSGRPCCIESHRETSALEHMLEVVLSQALISPEPEVSAAGPSRKHLPGGILLQTICLVPTMNYLPGGSVDCGVYSNVSLILQLPFSIGDNY